jgi:general secretion pathway protein G
MKLSTPARRGSRRAAFTLLEVLVVVAILVILASVASVATFSQLEKAKERQAQLKARILSQACEQYFLDPNSNSTYPTSVQQLVTPPWGQTSTPFLKDITNDILDPWQKPYQIQMTSLDNQTQTVLIMTSSPQGTPISQYGVGPKATPSVGQVQ